MSHPLLNDIVHKLEYVIKIIDTLKKSNQDFLTSAEAAEYLRVSKSTLYKHTSEGKLSFYKPNGKLMVFKKVDLNEWISKKRIKSNDEL